MPIMARRPDSDFEVCPEGLHQAVAVDVVDRGVQTTRWGDRHQVMLVWQVDAVDSRSRRFQIRNVYTNSLFEKAALRKDLEAWRGRRFTDDELKGFDLETLIGANAQIQVVHHIGETGSCYANLGAIVALSKSTPKIMPEGYVRAKDRTPAAGHAPQGGDDDVPF